MIKLDLSNKLKLTVANLYRTLTLGVGVVLLYNMAPMLMDYVEGEKVIYDQEQYDNDNVENPVLETTEESRAVVFGVASNAGFGSSVKIGEDLYLTNSHVVGSDEVVRIYDSKTKKFTQATVAKIDRHIDLALLYTGQGDLDVSEVLPKITLEMRAPLAGETVYAVGYPLAADIRTYEGTVNDEPTLDGELLRHSHSAFVAGGMSGGALFSKDGMLLGINFAGYPKKIMDHVVEEEVEHEGLAKEMYKDMADYPNLTISVEDIVKFLTTQPRELELELIRIG